jgi:hypothetical protein
MKPSEYPEVRCWPNLKRLLEIQVDMQFADIATMLRLPVSQPGLEAGRNLAGIKSVRVNALLARARAGTLIIKHGDRYVPKA